MGEVSREMGEIGTKMEDTTQRIADISNILGEQNIATDAVRDGITGIANQTGGQVSAIWCNMTSPTAPSEVHAPNMRSISKPSPKFLPD